MENRIKIFCDFDGTITNNDVWMKIGNYFIKDKEQWNKLIKRFESLEIGARECFINEISLIRDFDFKKFNEIIDKQLIDRSFISFNKFCEEHNIAIIILSEGMDYYIEKILERHGLKIPFYTNRCILSDDNTKIDVTFPYSDSECTRCGCCKRNFILNMTSDDEISVLIGDGFSDVCAAKYADIIFAKKSLVSYCWKNNITYFEFQNFSDIQKKLEKIMQHSIRHRQQAKFNRREVFLGG